MKNLAKLKGYPSAVPVALAFALLALAAGTGCRTAQTPQERALTLVFTSEVGGALDPCG